MHSARLRPSDHDVAAVAARLDRPVVLVGLMGAGKSTVGRKLAALLKTDFVDALRVGDRLPMRLPSGLDELDFWETVNDSPQRDEEEAKAATPTNYLATAHRIHWHKNGTQ